MSNALEEQIGWRIRKSREGKRLTLANLSDRTGLSKALLSKIENGKVSSPVSTLMLIAEALKVSLSYLVDNEGNKCDSKFLLVRRGERLRLDRGTGKFGFHYEMLAHDKANKLMEPAVLIVQNRRKNAVTFTHPGQELIYVLEGKMEFVYGLEKLVMDVGDSIYFDGDVPHGGRNLGKTPLRVLMVICDQ